MVIITEASTSTKVFPEKLAEIAESESQERLRNRAEALQRAVQYINDFYCMGESIDEYLENDRYLTDLQENLSQLTRPVDAAATAPQTVEQTVIDQANLAFHEQKVERLINILRDLTERKLHTLGMTFEDHVDFYHALEAADWEKAWGIAQRVEAVRLQRYQEDGDASWVTQVHKDFEANKTSALRQRIYQRVIDKFTRDFREKQPVLLCIGGLQGVGKTTYHTQPQPKLERGVNADLDDVRRELQVELQAEGLWKLFKGEYNESNGDMMEALAPESRHLLKLLVDACFEQNIPIVYQGTFRTKDKIDSWRKQADERSYRSEFVHLHANLEYCWHNAMRRIRGTPALKLLEAGRSFATMVEMIENPDKPDVLAIFITGKSTTVYYYDAVSEQVHIEPEMYDQVVSYWRSLINFLQTQ